MSINKNTLWTVFLFFSALMSPNLFVILGFSKSTVFNLTALAYALGAIALTIINRKTNQEDTLSAKKTDDFGLIIRLGVVSIFGALILQGILAVIEISVFNQPKGSQNTAEIRGIIRQSPLFIIAVSIAGPIMEEFVFRFSLINFLKQKINVWIAAVISSFAFAALHGDGHYLVYGGLGFLFFLIYKKTGSILTSIIAHAGMNTLVMILQLSMLK